MKGSFLMKKEEIKTVHDYIISHDKEDDPLYVPNIENYDKSEIGYIFLVESPHKNEIKEHIPLVGNSGKSVAKFLLNDNKSTIGELVYNKDKSLNDIRIAIVNVCNIPLQTLDENKDFVGKNELNDFRENNEIDNYLVDGLIKNIDSYVSAKVVIICGSFAKTYYEQIKDRIKIKRLKELYVPHPSYNHWNFIYEHKDDISTLKWLFNFNKDKDAN